jgi:hypothetical protein
MLAGEIANLGYGAFRWCRMVQFSVPYPKPTQLSDPFQDWYEARLIEVVSKHKADLTLADYNVIFYKTLHAATYEEGAYYIDGCFELMNKMEDRFDSNICEGLFHFINYHRKKLAGDHLLEPCLEATAELLRSYTSTFEVVRKGDDDPNFHVIDPTLPEVAIYEWSVWELIEELTEYPLYCNVVTEFFDWLDGDEVCKSCWWINISSYACGWLTSLPTRKEFRLRQPIIHRILNWHTYPRHLHSYRNYMRSSEKIFSRYERRVSIVGY